MSRTSPSAGPSFGLQRKALVVSMCVALASALAALPSASATTIAPVTQARGAAEANARSAQRARIFNHGGAAAVRDRAPQQAVISGNVLPVNSCADDGSADSLRAVVAAAGSGDTIDLKALNCSTITLTSGEIPVQVDNLTISGPGSTVLSINGDNAGRVIAHEGSGRLQISGVSLVDGLLATGSDYEGGCLLSNGDVELRDVTISGCRISDAPFGIGSGLRALGDALVEDSTIRDSSIVVDGAAGGSAIAIEGDLVLINSRITGNTVQITDVNDYGYIYFGAVNLWGKLTMTRSTVSNNSSSLADPETPYAFVWGGGVTAQGGGTIVESTIDGNSARDLGGGVTLGGGNVDVRHGLEIINTTISGNVADTGAGLMVRPEAGWVAIRSSTIVGNFAETGGGIYFDELDFPLIVELQNNVIANNIAASGADIGKSDRLTIYGASNIIVDVQQAVLLPADTLRVDPNVLPLADNGGPTRTHALGKGSPAIDAGNDYFELGHDQRGPGFVRVFGNEADIGAFEAQPLPGSVERIFAHGMEQSSP